MGRPFEAWGRNNPARIAGWYNLAGGGAGFLIVNYDSVDELTAFPQPYMDPLSFDVRAINQVDYDERIEALRRLVNQGARSPVSPSMTLPDRSHRPSQVAALDPANTGGRKGCSSLPPLVRNDR